MHIGSIGAVLLALASCTTVHAADKAGGDWQSLFDGKT